MKDQTLKKRLWIIGFILVLALVTVFPSIQLHSQPADTKEAYLKDHPQLASKTVKFGLDLAGGTSVVVELDLSQLPKNESPEDVVNTSLEILRNRVDQFGLSEPLITKTGPNRITAELAGVDQDGAKQLIGRTAKLEFKLVLDAERSVPVINRINQFIMQQNASASVLPSAVAPKTTQSIPAISSAAVQQSIQEQLAQKYLAGNATVKSVSSAAQKQIATASSVVSSSAALKVDTSKKDTAKLALVDTSKAAPVSNDQIKQLISKIGKRSFTGDANSLIANFDGEMVVRKNDVELVKSILANPEVQKLTGDIQLAIGFETKKLSDGSEVRYLYPLKKRAEMDGANVDGANPERLSGGMNAGEVGVSMRFNSKGAKDFAKVTGNYVGHRLAIVLDSQVVSAPKINDKIAGGNAQITGNFKFDEAKQLAVILKAGALKTPMHIVELRNVGATLGQENINISLMAGGISLGLIIIFMFLYYHRGGVNATAGLLMNMLLVGAVLSMFGATLTLPGIAGIILLIGMTVDGNVLVFERIREELSLGKTPRVAVQNAFKKAFSAIIDTHVAAIYTSVILYELGTGPIKGFGLTMIIGLCATLFCNLYLSKTLFLWRLNKDESALNVGKGWSVFKHTKVDVLAINRYTRWFSAAVFVATTIALFYPGLNKSIDFTGGQVITFASPDDASIDQVKVKVQNSGIENAQIKEVSGDAGKTYYQLRLHASANTVQSVDKLRKVLGSKMEVLSEDMVGPSISKDLSFSAWKSIFFALAGILLYIWFRFGRFGLGFGLGAIITLAHDISFTVLIFILFGIEVDAAFIAALLTNLGYSLNESIIIYDRIREKTELMGRDTYADRVNFSVNETFSRTIITSSTVFLTSLILAIFGAGSIKTFAIAMTVGVGIGTYSAIFISAPFVNWWAKKYGVKGLGKTH